MDEKEREKAIEKIKVFVDSGEEVDGKIRFTTEDGIRATYSMAQIILDMYDRMRKEEILSYAKRTEKFNKRRGTSAND